MDYNQLFQHYLENVAEKLEKRLIVKDASDPELVQQIIKDAGSDCIYMVNVDFRNVPVVLQTIYDQLTFRLVNVVQETSVVGSRAIQIGGLETVFSQNFQMILVDQHQNAFRDDRTFSTNMNSFQVNKTTVYMQFLSILSESREESIKKMKKVIAQKADNDYQLFKLQKDILKILQVCNLDSPNDLRQTVAVLEQCGEKQEAILAQAQEIRQMEAQF